ncbi:MAG TPA: pitrilysin family protein [Pyrinomonadaceae bacterium]|jgi:zinc protease
MKVIRNQWSAVGKFFLLTFVILSFVSAGLAQTAAEGKITNISEQAALVTEFDVGGLKVLVKRRASAPTVAVGLFIRGGAQNITDKNAGIENLMLNAMTEGSKKFPRETIRRELSRTGSSIGSSTGTDYSVVSLAATRSNFDRTWEIFTDILLNPAFETPDVERVRAQILSGLRERETNPDNFLEVLQERVIYANHPYANDVGGTISTIGNFTPNDLRAYHQKMMQTSRLLLVLVGDLDPKEMQKRIAESFGKLPRGEYKETTLPALDFSKATLDVAQRTLPTNYIRGVFNAPALNSPDYYAMRVAINILGSRLFQEVRVKRQLSYAPDADLSSLSANTASIYVTAVDANKTVGVMLNEINNLKKGEIDETEISANAGQFLTTYYLGQETNAAQASELAKYELVGGGWRNAFEFLNHIREVTAKDVQTVSNKYMKNIRFVVVGNQAAVDKQIFIPVN